MKIIMQREEDLFPEDKDISLHFSPFVSLSPHELTCCFILWSNRKN